MLKTGVQGFDRYAGSMTGSLGLRREQVGENIDRNARDLWEEMGVETDEACGVDHASLAQLAPKRARR
jgi:hypothetical protein